MRITKQLMENTGGARTMFQQKTAQTALIPRGDESYFAGKRMLCARPLPLPLPPEPLTVLHCA